MTIQIMSFDDISRVVLLHQRCLPGTRSSRIGKEYLQMLYTILVENPSLHLCLTVLEKKEIVGAITITLDIKKTQQLISRRLFPFGIPLLFSSLVTGRISLQELWQQMQFEQALNSQFSSPYQTILTMFVEETWRKSGVGTQLITEAEKKLQKKNIQEYYVDTLIINKGAQNFYKKMGFSSIQEIQDSVVLKKIIK